MGISKKLSNSTANVSGVHAVQNSVQAMTAVACRMDRLHSVSITRAIVSDKVALASFPYSETYFPMQNLLKTRSRISSV